MSANDFFHLWLHYRSFWLGALVCKLILQAKWSGEKIDKYLYVQKTNIIVIDYT